MLARKITLLLFFISLTLFTGCMTSPQPYQTFITDDDEVKREVRNYRLNQPMTAKLGDPIIKRGKLITKDIRHLMYVANFSREKDGIAVEEGENLEVTFSYEAEGQTVYWLKGEMEQSANFPQPHSPHFVICESGVVAKDNAEILNDAYEYEQYGEIPFFDGQDLNKELFSSNEELEDVSNRGSFEYALIYQGLENGKIKVLYQEFKDGIKVPFFHKNLTFEASTDKNIRYKNFEIALLEADPEAIRFIVLKE